MLEEIKPTLSDMELQDTIMEAGVAKIIEHKPEWIDVATAGARMYLVVVSQLGGPIPEIRFVHNQKPCKIQFKLRESEGTDEFVANDIDHKTQMAILDEMLTTAEASPNGHTLLDLAVCSARLFMIGYDGLAGTVEVIRFRHDQKNYSMNLIEEGK
ncbi:hypothetical protein HOT49_gp320 [Erwinia phage vB_EamM_Alexandra]|uniref:Uncharacterized protein n=1 Tax=Erwinia phage vB_EamM_Alexandra TaxID=2201424 RepID=A0A2Z4QE81_9CAUD|nr:hypothetical protein HOT49_gp320 [Erwinia phage vB_EamM_Alexandra]AWY08575.1 hypothetical protein Alexandra_324 [Erwinia phage vB_EamM_Alexandra]